MARWHGWFLFFLWGLLRCRREKTSKDVAATIPGSGHSAPCHLRRDGTRGWGLFFGLGDSFTCSGATRRVLCAFCFFGFVGGAVAVCFEGLLRGMCWPVDRPATHAAAGAAARGALIFCFGDCFTCSGVDGTRVKALWFFLEGILSHAQERRHEGLGELGGLIFPARQQFLLHLPPRFSSNSRIASCECSRA